MKHTRKVTYILVLFFLISQFIGLLIISLYINVEKTKEAGYIVVDDLPFGIERPPIEGTSSVWYIMSAILIGTLFLLLIIKFHKKINKLSWVALISIVIIFQLYFLYLIIERKSIIIQIIRLIIGFVLLYLLINKKKSFDLWKTWYFLSVLITLGVAFFAFFKYIVGFDTGSTFAAILALIIGYYKIFRPHVWLHNFSELFIYGGLAAIFVYIMNFLAAVILLILISIYDMYAVWKSKHMIKLAEFTTSSQVFAGLSVPYNKASGKIQGSMQKVKLTSKNSSVRNAILGGGDIGFPLIFAGVVMKSILEVNNYWIGFLKAMIIPVFTSVALYILFVKGDKNKFYPAMPFLSAGCFVGYGVLLLVGI